MRKIYLPLLFNKGNSIAKENGLSWLPGSEECRAYHSLDDAREAAKKLALSDPKGKVMILVSERIIEPRKVEFSEKEFTPTGELLV